MAKPGYPTPMPHTVPFPWDPGLPFLLSTFLDVSQHHPLRFTSLSYLPLSSVAVPWECKYQNDSLVSLCVLTGTSQNQPQNNEIIKLKRTLCIFCSIHSEFVSPKWHIPLVELPSAALPPQAQDQSCSLHHTRGRPIQTRNFTNPKPYPESISLLIWQSALLWPQLGFTLPSGPPVPVCIAPALSSG